VIPNIMSLKKRTAPTATATPSSSQHFMPKKRTDPTATASINSACRLEGGLDDGASLSSSSGDKPTMQSSCRRRLGSGRFSSQEIVVRDKQNNDPKYLPIDALVDEMICVRKDYDRAETKELLSKLSVIIQEMQGGDEIVPRIINKNEIGLVSP